MSFNEGLTMMGDMYVFACKDSKTLLNQKDFRSLEFWFESIPLYV